MYEATVKVHKLFTDRYKIVFAGHSMKNGRTSGQKGRPRSFDPDKALDRALQVFWRKGYEGASLTNLTRAMGINRPSLYAAFGDKKSLFLKALDRYQQGPGSFVNAALKEPTAKRVVERLLLGAAEALSDPRNPRGCLTVQGALACGDQAKAVQCHLIASREGRKAIIRKRLQQAKNAGDLSSDSNPAYLAGFVVTVLEGMAVQAVNGASRGQLRGIAETALRAWPKE